MDDKIGLTIALANALAKGPTNTQVTDAVDTWLEDHPDATTTVEDGAITNAKLASSFVTPGTAAAYSSSATYAVGDYCFYNGTLYRCTTAITTAEAWTAGHWTAAVMGDDVGDLKSAVNENMFEFLPLTWEKGGISLTDGQPTQDGSETRSRVIDYLDTNKIYKVINNTSATLWMVFYSKNGNAYTFVNSVNVDAGNALDTSINHARYMRLDFRSSVSDAAGISILSNSLLERVDNIDMSNVVNRIGDIDGIVPVSVNDFFCGNISVNNGAVTYGNYQYRVATRNGVTYPLVIGDEIYLNDYTDARFYPFYEISGTWYSSGSWITGGKFTVNTSGNYAILLSNLTETEQAGVEDLAGRLVIRKNTLKLYVDELLPKIDAAKKPKNASADGYLQELKPLVLFHFSDIHGDAIETNRINSVYQPIVNKCDDVICTGDMVASRFANDASFIVNKGFLLVIGNHDALADPSGWDWSQMATQEQLYDKFFAMGIASWGVTYTPNITYYYKDYADSGIRLIVLTNFLTTSEMDAQKDWLTSVLNDALENNLAVVIAMHYRPGDTQKKASNFTKIDSSPSNNTSGGAIPYRVSQFIANGGEFIGYICGHEHSDYLLESTVYSDQIAVLIDAASVSQSNTYSDLSRNYGDHTQDLYNVFVADRSTKTIKVIRVGCDVDNYVRSRKTLTIRYDTKEIITQD